MTPTQPTQSVDGARYDREALEKLRPHPRTGDDAPVSYRAKRIRTLFTALAESEKRVRKAVELADKYKWQVRDTCTRAEKAEASLATAQAENARLRKYLEEIREEDELPDSHPCGPKEYGHFGRLAGEALSPAAAKGEEPEEPLDEHDRALIDAAWEHYKAAVPVAVVVNNNQPGRQTIVEVLREPPTLEVGLKLYAEPAPFRVPTTPRPVVPEGLVRLLREYEASDFEHGHSRWVFYSSACGRYVRALIHDAASEPEADPGFTVGERVEKYKGEARWIGTIVSAYTTGKGSPRYVVDVEPQGFQMIAVPSQLRSLIQGGDNGQC